MATFLVNFILISHAYSCTLLCLSTYCSQSQQEVSDVMFLCFYSRPGNWKHIVSSITVAGGIESYLFLGLPFLISSQQSGSALCSFDLCHLLITSDNLDV